MTQTMLEKNEHARQQMSVVREELREMFLTLRNIETRIYHEAGSTATLAASLEALKERAGQFNNAVCARDQELLDDWRELKGVKS